eukprot:TRINITY_DN200_c0_g1_i1.p1 TRINITY_DN200_c0_g1~~TRINITY_DN200_c0_g1_i1.p1  ORF type:complete len:615 (-),score=-31.21 TRINITY_DN200_c0_g1_i1:59-1903(-)
MKHAPGPLPSSCLTCRKRRKKCDRGQPFCTRCTAGGFRCLGYELASSGSDLSNLGSSSLQLDATAVPPASLGLRRAPQRKQATHMSHEELRPQTVLDESRTLGAWSGEGYDDIANESWDLSNSRLTFDSDFSPPLQIFPQPQTDTGNPRTRVTQSHSDEVLPPIASITLESLGLPSSNLPPPQPSPSHDSIVISPNSPTHQRSPPSGAVMNCITLPPRFYPDPVTSGSTIKFIMSLYEPLFHFITFKPKSEHYKFIQSHIAARIQVSDLTYWSMFLGAKVFRTLLQGGQERDLRAYKPWFERLSRLCITSRNDDMLEDLNSRLLGALELCYLLFISSDTNAAYTLMKNIAPTFVKVALADPALWPRQFGSSGLSLVHMFTSYRFGIGRFFFMDALTSLTFGVPPLIEYDTSASVSEISLLQSQRIESIQGCTAIFAIGIIKINAWRAYNHGPPASYIWEAIEADVWSWEPQPEDGPPDDSWKSIARLAIKEGWRHAVLIYLYMGMCRRTSYDPLVQSSVQQIMNLLEVIRLDDPLCVHFFFACLLAGICVRSEKQRGQIRTYMNEARKNTAWFFSGTDMASVLDHLWHGAAANGGEVTWEDYIRSRRAKIYINA